MERILSKKFSCHGNFLRGAPDVHDVLELLRSGARPRDHLVGDVETDDLTATLGTLADEPCEDSGGPAHAAPEVEHTLAGLRFHSADSLLGDADVVRSISSPWPAAAHSLNSCRNISSASCRRSSIGSSSVLYPSIRWDR